MIIRYTTKPLGVKDRDKIESVVKKRAPKKRKPKARKKPEPK